MGSFVGREQECGGAVDALARALAPADGEDPPPTVVLVSGEAGVGKSRLVEEVLARLGPEVLVGRGTAFQSDDVVPLVPVAALLRDLLRRLPDDVVDELVAPVRPALARLLPELGPAADADASRPGDVVPWVLSRIAALRPVVVVVDDVQWADASTLDLVARVPSQVLGRFALVLVRRNERRPSERVTRVLVDLVRQRGAVEVALAPLPEGASGQLVRMLVDDAVGAHDQRRIVQRARGNPLFLEALSRTAREGGDLPELLVEALLAPVRDLSADGQALCHAAAVWGAPARPSALASLAGVDLEGSDAPWREARDAGVLVDVDDSVDVRHPLLREALLDDLTVVRRSRLTADAVALLAERVDEGEASVRDHAAIAAMLERLGRRREAAVAYVRAADETVRVSYAEAAAQETRALALWDDAVAAETGVSRRDLLARLAEHLHSAGETQTSIARAQEAFALWRAEPGGDTRTGSELAALVATCGEWELDERDVQAALEQSIELAERSGSAIARARALVGAARHSMSLDLNAPALDLAQRALAAATEAGDAEQEAAALAVLGGSLGQLGRVDEADDALTRALASLDDSMADAERRRAWIDLRRAFLRWLSGDPGGAADEVEGRALGLVGHRVAVTYPWIALATAAELHVWAGQHDRAEAAIDRVHQALDAGGLDFSLIRSILALAEAELALRRGRLDRASDLLEANLALWESRGLRDTDFHDLLRLAECRLLQGQVGAARELVGEALPGVLESDSAEEISCLVRLGVLVEGTVARTGGRADTARVETLLARATALEEAGGAAAGSMPAAELAAARAEAARVAGTESVQLWETAASAWAGAGVPWWTVWCQVRQAEALVAARGARTDAARLLALARPVAQRLDAAPLLAMVADLERRAGLAPAPSASSDDVVGGIPAQPSGPAGSLGAQTWESLTAREREVVGLVAAGRSNRQIARELFISEKTASVHVSNVLAKWGLRSRLEVAAVAHRLGVGDPV
jgi:DNA-binding CsgD family transcriptional regulator/tetratricopeptide (TPR) repeat protein